MSSELRGSDTLTDNSTHTSRVYNVCMYIKKQEVLGLSMDGFSRALHVVVVLATTEYSVAPLGVCVALQLAAAATAASAAAVAAESAAAAAAATR